VEASDHIVSSSELRSSRYKIWDPGAGVSSSVESLVNDTLRYLIALTYVVMFMVGDEAHPWQKGQESQPYPHLIPQAVVRLVLQQGNARADDTQ
jgi:hypothetical protein